MAGVTLAVVSDLHANSVVGLSPSSVALDDGGTYTPSDAQRWLWARWKEYLAAVDAASARRHLVVIANGDLAEKDSKKRSFQLITRNPVTIQRMAVACLEPLVAKSDRFFVVRGTEAHAGKSANLEEKIAEDLGAVKCPETDTWSWWELLAEWQKVRLHVAHHTQTETEDTPGSSMARLARRMIVRYTDRGEPVPGLVIRSHIHRYRDSHDAYATCRAISTPAWQLATAYVHRIASDTLADVGGLIIQIDKGDYVVKVMRYPTRRRVPWRERGT